MMLSVFLGISLMVWGFICLLIAVIYAIFYPHSKNEIQLGRHWKWRFLILRWFHSIVWLLLGLSCFIWGEYIPVRTELANVLAILSLLIYVTFIATLVMERKARR